MTALVAALAGADSLISAGGLDGVQISSLAKYVLDNDQVGALRRYLREDAIDETTALMDDILEVGIGGHFLGRRSTRQHARTEVWRPRAFRKGTFEEFAGRSLAGGGRRAGARDHRDARGAAAARGRGAAHRRRHRALRRPSGPA